MKYRFEPRSGLILVNVTVYGPASRGQLSLALDTGATYSMLSPAALVTAGYDLGAATNRMEITTASGLEDAPLLNVMRLAALGLEQSDFLVLAHTLPPSAGIDGLLGLDFFRGHRLAIDFMNGEIALE
jgi:predicted aspartyl protease